MLLGFILRFVPANSDFNGYCFDVYGKHFNDNQSLVGQLVFKKDFSDVVPIGFDSISYDSYAVEKIIQEYSPEAQKMIIELKNKGILTNEV